jgi:dTMP kinase
MAERGRAGLFVTFEGIEGSGKTTQARLLVEALTARGIAVKLTREPGGTRLGERLRQILLDLGSAGMLPESELFLYLASRAEHVVRVIAPALERGEVVVSDRFGDASVAYQGGGRRLGAAAVESLNEVATRGVKPDVTFLLDLDAEEGLARLSGRVGPRDRIESEEIGFHRRVRETYLDLARRDPARVVVVDARPRPEAVAAIVEARVNELLERRSVKRDKP